MNENAQLEKGAPCAIRWVGICESEAEGQVAVRLGNRMPVSVARDYVHPIGGEARA